MSGEESHEDNNEVDAESEAKLETKETKDTKETKEMEETEETKETGEAEARLHIGTKRLPTCCSDPVPEVS